MNDNKTVNEQEAISNQEQLNEQAQDGGCGCGPACCGPSGSQGSGFSLRKFFFYGVVVAAVGVAMFSLMA
jgi:hypothetical protein